MNGRIPPIGARWLLSLCTAPALLLAACAGEPTAHEQALGESLRQAQQRQLALPALGAGGERGAIVSDGVIAAHGLDRYHQSWLRPPAPVSVLNIQASGAASAPPVLPR